TITPAGMLPRVRQFTVVGIFESGHYEYDSTLAMIDIDDAQKLFRLPAPTGVRLRLKDMQRAPEVAVQLSHSLSGDLYIRDWTQQNKTWFSAVKIEKRMMFIILTLIIAVAAFNLVSSLVMTVTNKQADIAILRTLGAQQSRRVGRRQGHHVRARGHHHACRHAAAREAVHGGRHLRVGALRIRQHAGDDRHRRRAAAVPAAG
ncbi:hypothetical protein PPH41_45385, partial [Burkholderia gladioli]|nr:hypothetical protein [Burkholderia gladioli]